MKARKINYYLYNRQINMIKKAWTAVSNIGILSEMPEKEVKRLTLINQYTVMAFIIYLFNAITNVILGFMWEGILLAILASIFIFALFLNKLHKHRTSLLMLCIFISLTIFYFGSRAGVQSGDYLYYFPLILGISFIFDYESDRLLVMFLFGLIIVLVTINTFVYPYFSSDNLEFVKSRQRMFMVNLPLSAAALGYFIHLTMQNNKVISQLYEERLKQKEESEQVIKKTLAEKEVLLAELHHRVKNNLAVIVGYFNLKLNGIENEQARTILLESKNHVNSMALIHNRLYKTGNFSEINFTTYFKDLLSEIRESYPSMANSVVVNTQIENVKLNLNTAIPCALIINELLNNCYKHAFKATQKGTISINLFFSENNTLTLSVKDNGVGLKENFDKDDSMGISVIQGLSEQLNGSCRFFNDSGACFSLVFKKE